MYTENKSRPLLKLLGVMPLIAIIVIGYSLTSRDNIQNPTQAGNNSRTYFVNCNDGSDANDGQSQQNAWQTLDKVNQPSTILLPGDELLLKNDCVWEGYLNARWRGSSESSIKISNYGDGELPTIKNITFAGIEVSGTNQIIDNIKVTNEANTSDTCIVEPDSFSSGVLFEQKAANNIIQNLIIENHNVGIYSNSDGNHSNKILNNQIKNNRYIQLADGDNAFSTGATGLKLINSNGFEIAFNTFESNYCASSQSNQANSSIFIHNSKNNLIHHNKAVSENRFITIDENEVGNSDGLTIAYNLMNSNLNSAKFLINFASTYTSQTTLANNTVYLTGTATEALNCQNCDTQIFDIKNNIFWAQGKIINSNSITNEISNLFWSNFGRTNTGIVNLNNQSIIKNPLFVVPGQDFSLTAASPARNTGSGGSGFTKDLNNTQLPKEDIFDLGAYEYAL